MHTTENHPNRNPAMSGRGRRFVTRTRATRHMRLDTATDNALMFVYGQLADPENLRDKCSVSLIARRAIRLYERHIAQVRLNPSSLYQERQAVRAMSQMPGRRPRGVAEPTRKVVLQ